MALLEGPGEAEVGASEGGRNQEQSGTTLFWINNFNKTGNGRLLPFGSEARLFEAGRRRSSWTAMLSDAGH